MKLIKHDSCDIDDSIIFDIIDSLNNNESPENVQTQLESAIEIINARACLLNKIIIDKNNEAIKL